MFRKFANKIGINRTIFYTVLARGIQAMGGVVTIFFIARFLTESEQGFYYTFGSILAIQIFFELGMNNIIVQYVAHETSFLSWDSSNNLSGDSKHLSRISSLLKFSIQWYSVFALILFAVLFCVGFIFFGTYGKNQNEVIWKTPWIILTLFTSVNLIITPILAFLEGLNKVKEIALIRLFQQIVYLLAVWIGLTGGLKLFVLGISGLFGLLTVCFLLKKFNFFILLRNILKIQITEKVNYRLEIFPYQWKIALSWISGYFIFQLFNPVLFATEGAIVAGKMGMTLAILNGIQALSMSWITTKVPLFSGLIAQKNYNYLDSIFNKTFIQSVLINLSAILLFLLIIFVTKINEIHIFNINFSERIIGLIPLLFMCIPLFANQFISSWATYLRCHKREPFLSYSVITGILCCFSTIFLGKHYGLYGITAGYCLITLAMMPWAYYIFKTKKNEWHK